MENTTFNYTYSAARNKEVESIRNKYMPREGSLCFGIVGALVFGIGMCFFLDVFAGAAWLTALLMVLGAVIMIPAYPIYR